MRPIRNLTRKDTYEPKYTKLSHVKLAATLKDEKRAVLEVLPKSLKVDQILHD